MITKTIHRFSEIPACRVYVHDMGITTTLILDTNLHDESYDNYEKRLKDKFRNETNNLILVVVKFVPNFKDWTSDRKSWNKYMKCNHNRWGFKVLTWDGTPINTPNLTKKRIELIKI